MGRFFTLTQAVKKVHILLLEQVEQGGWLGKDHRDSATHPHRVGM